MTTSTDAMQYTHDRETARAGTAAGKLFLGGTLLALVSALAAVQAAHAGAEIRAAQMPPDTVRADGHRFGLSSDSLRLAIHVNREEVESDDDKESGSSASGEHDDEQDAGEGDREEPDDADGASSDS